MRGEPCFRVLHQAKGHFLWEKIAPDLRKQPELLVGLRRE